MLTNDSVTIFCSASQNNLCKGPSQFKPPREEDHLFSLQSMVPWPGHVTHLSFSDVSSAFDSVHHHHHRRHHHPSPTSFCILLGGLQAYVLFCLNGLTVLPSVQLYMFLSLREYIRTQLLTLYFHFLIPLVLASYW